MSTGTTIHTILQCFVDINLETDENSTFSLKLLDVSFNQSSYFVDEGQIVEVDISLSAPSVDGFEEVDIGFIDQSTIAADYNLLGEIYPKTLTWSAGQQTHTLRFLANSDFIEEGDESFDLIIGTFINVNPGLFITSSVNIIDLTNLKEVFINSLGGNFQISDITSANTLTFSTIEGFSKEITVSLDSPSVFGVESATISFTNLTTNFTDFSILGSTNLSWSIGEQDKTFKIQAIDDGIIEDLETLGFEITSAVNANIDNPFKAEFKIFDNSPKTRFINVNFQGIYTQIGGFNFQNVMNLRHILNNEEISQSSGDETMLLRFGDKFRQIHINSININSPVANCGSNCIRTTVSQPFQGTEIIDTVFFGQNPNTGDFGDVRLKITSRGQFSVIIDGNQLNQGDSITLDVDSFDYNITLPANDVLISGGTIFQGNILSADTISEALYEFEIETDYKERVFVLKDLTNNENTIKTIGFGIHRFEETYELINATASTNQHNLVTTYNQVLANWDRYPNTSISPRVCLPSSYYSNNTNSFPSNPTDAISVSNGFGHARINGFAIISDNSINYLPYGINDGPSGYEESKYISVEFLPSGQTIGITCAPVSYPGTTNRIAWTSLAFEIIP